MLLGIEFEILVHIDSQVWKIKRREWSKCISTLKIRIVLSILSVFLLYVDLFGLFYSIFFFFKTNQSNYRIVHRTLGIIILFSCCCWFKSGQLGSWWKPGIAEAPHGVGPRQYYYGRRKITVTYYLGLCKRLCFFFFFSFFNS